jgi:hypothetical protein
VVLGGGLLAFSIMGADTGADADGTESHAHGAAGGDLVLGIFRLRNMTFLFATFGITGAALTWLGASPAWAFAMAITMGIGAMMINHALFTWIKRADSAGNLVEDIDLVGMSGRVVLTVAPGQRGRIVCTVAGREQYLLARLSPGQADALIAGSDIVVLSVKDGVAEITPFDALPQSTLDSLTE